MQLNHIDFLYGFLFFKKTDKRRREMKMNKEISQPIEQNTNKKHHTHHRSQSL